MPAEWVVADTAAPDRRLLYLHGGGYVICSPATHRDLAGRISKAAGVSVLVLDYRLAPEPRRSSAASCPLNRAVPGHGHDLLAAPGQGGTGTGGWAVMDL